MSDVAAEILALVSDLSREVVHSGVNQYDDLMNCTLLAEHLWRHRGDPLFVGESPATLNQAVAFTDESRSSQRFHQAVADHPTARWNAWPFWHTVKPNTAELRRGAEYAKQVVKILEPCMIIAVGRTAERCLNMAQVQSTYVPHPAQDRAGLFRDMVREILEETTS